MAEQALTLILFDIDGTLLTSAHAGRLAVRLALEELFGFTGSTESVAFAGSTDWRILQDILLPLGYTSSQVADLVPVFAEVVARHLEMIIPHHPVRPLPGAVALVEALVSDDRARLGLVTGNVAQSVPIKLRAAGFDPAHFPVGAFGHEAVERSALPPLAVQRAREMWGVDFPPQRIVVVGDTPNDVICTRSVGGRAIGVLTGPLKREALAAESPYAILEDLTDSARVMAALFGEEQEHGG